MSDAPQSQRNFVRPTLAALLADPCPMSFMMAGAKYVVDNVRSGRVPGTTITMEPAALAGARRYRDLCDLGFETEPLEWAGRHFYRSTGIVWPDGLDERELVMDPIGFVVWVRDMCRAAAVIRGRQAISGQPERAGTSVAAEVIEAWLQKNPAAAEGLTARVKSAPASAIEAGS